MRVHQPHVQPVRTKKFGADLSAKDMQNSPFRAAIQDGHSLNESYKLPAPNASGTNHSYAHPIPQGRTQVKANKPPRMKDDKNTY